MKAARATPPGRRLGLCATAELRVSAGASHPNVKAKASMAALPNSISKVRSTMGLG
jgi:hypothetical protein